MKKRFIALSLTLSISLFNFGGVINPCYAILDRNINTEKTIMEYINYDWWKNQNDEYLESYIQRAIENNHDIKTAQLKIEQAKINVTATRAGQLPSFQVSASPMINKMPYSEKSMGTFALPLMASYELDIFGKNRNKTQSSKKLLKSTQYQAQASNISVVSMVGSIYYNIVKLDKIISLEQQLVENRKEIFELTKISNKEGLTSTSDLILAEKNYVLSQNDLLDYEKSRQNALNALAVLIGDSPENSAEFKRISFDNLSNDFNIPNEISSQIIINRPDYKALEAQLEAAGIDIRVAKKEFLPTIDILGILSFAANSSIGGNMGWKNAMALAGASATLPIFTGFKRLANLKMSKNAYEQILEQYQKTNLVAMQEINDSLYNLKSDKEKLLNNQKAYEIQKEDYNISDKKFQLGVISKLDLLQQHEALLYIEQLRAGSKIDCFIDKIGLYKATGARV